MPIHPDDLNTLPGPGRRTLVLLFVLLLALLLLVAGAAGSAAGQGLLLFLGDAHATVPVLVGVWRHLDANANPAGSEKIIVLQLAGQ